MGNNIGAWEAHVAVKSKNLTFIQEGLESGRLNPNLRFRGETLLSTSIHAKYLEMSKVLLDAGADPNLKAKEGGRNEPPLITAARFRNLGLVKILVESGADVLATNFYGHDVIYQAVIESSIDILDYLLRRIPLGEISHHTVWSTCQVCPLMLAIKESALFPLQRGCLRVLLKFNYTCSCLETKYIVYMYRFYQLVYRRCPEILEWVYLGKGLRFYYKGLKGFSGSLPISLKILCRISIRDQVSKAALSTGNNFVTLVAQLPLPNSLIEYLLLSDIC